MANWELVSRTHTHTGNPNGQRDIHKFEKRKGEKKKLVVVVFSFPCV
jgi:hypothetical protein